LTGGGAEWSKELIMVQSVADGDEDALRDVEQQVEDALLVGRPHKFFAIPAKPHAMESKEKTPST